MDEEELKAQLRVDGLWVDGTKDELVQRQARSNDGYWCEKILVLF